MTDLTFALSGRRSKLARASGMVATLVVTPWASVGVYLVFCIADLIVPETSLNVLYLLAHLLDEHFQFHRCAGGFGVRGFGA